MNTLTFATPTTNLTFAPAWAFDQDTPGLDESRAPDHQVFAFARVTPLVAGIEEITDLSKLVRLNPRRTQQSVADVPLGRLEDVIDPGAWIDEPSETPVVSRICPIPGTSFPTLPDALAKADALGIALDLGDWLDAKRRR